MRWGASTTAVVGSVTQPQVFLDTKIMRMVDNATSVNDHDQAESPRRAAVSALCEGPRHRGGGAVRRGQHAQSLVRTQPPHTRLAARPAAGRRTRGSAGGHRHDFRHGEGLIRRRASRRHGDDHARRPRLHALRGDARRRHLHLHAGPHRRLHGPRRVPGLPRVRAPRHRRQPPAAVGDRLLAGNRQRDRGGRGHRRGAAARDRQRHGRPDPDFRQSSRTCRSTAATTPSSPVSAPASCRPSPARARR